MTRKELLVAVTKERFRDPIDGKPQTSKTRRKPPPSENELGFTRLVRASRELNRPVA